MNVYIEYSKYEKRYNQAMFNYNDLLQRKEDLLAMAQPHSQKFDQERVSGGNRPNLFDEYLIKKEKENLDELLKESKSILEDRKMLLDMKREELKHSKSPYDRIYWYRYIEKYKVRRVAMAVGYSEAQVYRILNKIEERTR